MQSCDLEKFRNAVASILIAIGVSTRCKPVAAEGILDPAAVSFSEIVEKIRRDSLSADGRVSFADFCAKLVARHFDLQAMGEQASAGAAARMTPELRARYFNVFANRINGECVRRAGPYLQEAIRLVSSRKISATEMLVATTQSGGGNDPQRQLIWRLRSIGQRIPKVTDVIANGRSAVLDAQSEAKMALSNASDDPAAVVEAFRRR